MTGHQIFFDIFLRGRGERWFKYIFIYKLYIFSFCSGAGRTSSLPYLRHFSTNPYVDSRLHHLVFHYFNKKINRKELDMNEIECYEWVGLGICFFKGLSQFCK